MKTSVSLVKYVKSPESLKEAVSLCEGFAKLDKSMRVLIKPNLVAWDDVYGMAPYGVYTTTRLVEDLLILLKDFGCDRIAIGEGSVSIKKGVGTMQAFEGLGYDALAKRYGADLVDFNESPSVNFKTPDGLFFNVAREAVECDYLVNFPVLKTHGQTKVSLGLKNLKGCLKTSSKKLCHHIDFPLEYCFSFIADYVKPALTIVDGIYALEKGALHYGNAFRKDIIVASTDVLAADLAAAATIGYGPADIVHFGEYAKRHGKSLSMDDYEIKGERLEDHVKPLKWDWGWTKDNTGPAVFDKLGVKGAALPKYDDSLCSGCSPIANMVNILALSAFKGEPLPSVEILNGKKMQARPGYRKTILLGNCIIKANEKNPDINEALRVKGCPPAYEEVVAALREAGMNVNEAAYHGYQKQQSEKYDGKEGYTWDFFRA